MSDNELQKNFKVYKMKLTALSPVFIGSGESIAGIKDEQDLKNKLFKNKGSIDDWVKFFTEQPNPSLQSYLRKYPCSDVKVNNHTDGFITTVGQPYIPGSSIKGALHTAIMFENKNEDLAKIMQCIQVSDSKPFSQDETFLAKIEPRKIIKDYGVGKHLDNAKEKQLLNISHRKRSYNIYIYIKLNKNSKYNTITQILETLENFYGKVLDENKKDLQESESITQAYDSSLGLKPNINLGGQSGFNTKVTLRGANSRPFEEYMEEKKRVLRANFKNHRHNDPGIEKAPRYLKFVKYREGEFTLGWCNLSCEAEVINGEWKKCENTCVS